MKRGVQKVGSSIKPLAKYAYPLINALFSGSVNFSLVDQSKYLWIMQVERGSVIKRGQTTLQLEGEMDLVSSYGDEFQKKQAEQTKR